MSKTYLLPRSQVQVCLKPGTDLTKEELAELDNYFLQLHPEEGPGGMDPDTGYSPQDEWLK